MLYGMINIKMNTIKTEGKKEWIKENKVKFLSNTETYINNLINVFFCDLLVF